MMYFNNDIKIHNFKNESYFNSCLTCMFRADSAQKWTNEDTAENECYTMGNPDDTGVFQFDLKARKSIKDGFFNQWNKDVDHLFFARVDCCNDDIFEWNKEMHQEMQTILRDMQNRHYYPILIVIHNDQPKEYCHFHILLDYIDPDVKP